MEDFQPWAEMHAILDKIKREGPPCLRCKYWFVSVRTWNCRGKPAFDGLQLCHAPEQYDDFSCFRPKESLADPFVSTETGRVIREEP